MFIYFGAPGWSIAHVKTNGVLADQWIFDYIKSMVVLHLSRAHLRSIFNLASTLLPFFSAHTYIHPHIFLQQWCCELDVLLSGSKTAVLRGIYFNTRTAGKTFTCVSFTLFWFIPRWWCIFICVISLIKTGELRARTHARRHTHARAHTYIHTYIPTHTHIRACTDTDVHSPT